MTDKLRLALAVPLVSAVALVDSVSWILSFTSDLVIGSLLVAVLTIGRK